MRSPWERALGDVVGELAPGLRAYFGAIPAGSVGRGSGVFETVGTPRRWLWPVFALFSRAGILFPGWFRDVPSTVENRSTPSGTVRAIRTFHFADGDRAMVDETGMTARGLTDRLGSSGTVSALLEPRVVGGHLHLRSTSVALGRLRLPWPVVELTEQTDGDRQRVSLRLTAPIIGVLYEYGGTFTYRIEEEHRA